MLDALGAIEVGMRPAQVIQILGRPDGDPREDYWSYELSPVASFDVDFEARRVTAAGYGADTPPPFDPNE